MVGSVSLASLVSLLSLSDILNASWAQCIHMSGSIGIMTTALLVVAVHSVAT